MNTKLTNKIFIEKSILIHENKYDYLSVDYKNNKTKVKIICPTHGVFEQRPDAHLNGIGCKKCTSDKRKKNIIEFINASNIIHNNKYDYSKVNYINARTKVKIICPNHGVFEQDPNTHTCLKHGCPRCKGQNKTTEDFINESNIIHNNKYCYDLTLYVKTTKNVKIICADHGVFEQTPHSHLKGCGCPVCNISKGEDLIKKFLDNNNLKYIWHHSFDDCKNKNVLWFDFYLPENNLCIEFDGIQHYKPIEFFHGIEGLKYIQKNDKIKNKYCVKNGINLIRFKYNEVINFDEIITL